MDRTIINQCVVRGIRHVFKSNALNQRLAPWLDLRRPLDIGAPVSDSDILFPGIFGFYFYDVRVFVSVMHLISP